MFECVCLLVYYFGLADLGLLFGIVYLGLGVLVFCFNLVGYLDCLVHLIHRSFVVFRLLALCLLCLRCGLPARVSCFCIWLV